jgi:FAD/FMN-containing dehydrogenase
MTRPAPEAPIPFPRPAAVSPPRVSPPRSLSGWGRHPVLPARLAAPKGEREAAALLAARGADAAPRGAGRAYGDAALPPPNGLAISTRRMSRLLSLDEARGILAAEAGALLGDIENAMLPRGLFPPVVPGTRFVTLGGMIAADVHGKNHHAPRPRGGSLSEHLEWVEVMGADGGVRRLRPGERGFAETCGGMGLTGLILRAALRLRPVETGWLRQTTIAAPDLDSLMAAIEDAADATYTVGWIDCLARGAALGRGLAYRGEHAAAEELPPRCWRDRWAMRPAARRLGPFPDLFPAWALNSAAVGAFNRLYGWSGRRRAARGTEFADWASFFHPLDAVLGWNRVYGRRGFVQFQCVLPPDAAREGLERMLREVSGAGQGSFLAVLKKLGEGAPDIASLSFPRAGWTLALDFPAAAPALSLVRRLHGLTRDHGGRIYLAKDALQTREEFEGMEPRAAGFRDSSARDGAFATALARRLGL